VVVVEVSSGSNSSGGGISASYSSTVVKYSYTCKVMEYQRVIVDNRSNRRNLVDKLQSADTDRKQLWEQVSSFFHTYMHLCWQTTLSTHHYLQVEAGRELQWVVEPLRQSQHQRRQVLN
jgi:hypothetical protein